MRKFINNKGQVLLIVTVIMALASAYMIIMVDRAVHSTKINKILHNEAEALWLAESGVNKAIWCLNQTSGADCGGTYGENYVGETNVSLDDGIFTITVSGTGASRNIVSTGNSFGGETKVVMISASAEPQTVTQSGFDFSVQAGGGGIKLDNNAEATNAPIYSGNNIDCKENALASDDVFVSSVGGKIENCENIRDAYADKVLGCQINRDAYYKNDPDDITGTTVGGTKYPGSPTPEPQSLPSFDLDFWHEAAEAGGVINGDYTPTDGSTLGPKKINGNLLVDAVDLTITGPVWVVGNITLTNNAIIHLSSDFGEASGLLLADNPADQANSGIIVIENNGTILRSDIDGSYMFFVSTNTRVSDTSPAIRVSNNVDGGVFYALNGSAIVNNNGSVTAVAGYRVYLSNNTTVNYDDTGATPVSMKLATTEAGTWHKSPGSRSEQD